MVEFPIKREDAIAFFKFEVISEMLDAVPGTVEATAKRLATQKFNDVLNSRLVSFSERTIFRYYSDYKKHGFDALKPKIRCDRGNHPGINLNIISDILDLKKELPTRSASKIIIMLVLAGKINEAALHRRTVNRILSQYGYTRESLSKDATVHVKHEQDSICDMWQSDVMSAFYLPDGSGGKKLAYLIGIIDDHSRRDMHSEFYFDSTLARLEDTLRKAVIKFGAPTSLYVDNGKIYISSQFKLICAKLGIKLRYATPYHPAGKGKIEKYWQFVQSSFIAELKNHNVKSLSELNDLYFAWKKAEYDDRVHSSIEMTPVQRWNESLKSGAKLRFFSPVELEGIFLHETERTVDKYGIIQFVGNTYEAPGELVGRSVVVKYNPFHLDCLHVYYNDKYFGTARIIDLKTQRHKSVGSIPEESGYDTVISRLYLKNIRSNYQKYLEDQLNLSIDTSCAGKDTAQVCDEDKKPHPVRPARESEYIISRDEFINIVKKAIGMAELTYQEKGKLHELWGTFKDFNKGILETILEDLSHKAADFNRNFLHYISQIRSLYLEKLAKAGEDADE